MSIQDEVREGYERFAAGWREKVWVGDEEYRKTIREFAGVKGGERVVDFGIGAGDLPDTLGCTDVTGIDISPAMLAVCRERHPSYVLVEGDGLSTAFPSDEFDVACGRNFLQNFIDPVPAFLEMVRVAKPGGMILCVESAVHRGEEEFPTMFCRVAESYHPMFLSHEGLFEMFQSAGLKNIEHMKTGVRKPWFQKWMRSKAATPEQAKASYQICKDYPSWYLERYQFEFDEPNMEITSLLTFGLVKGEKT